jgi:hypothetical protein
MAKDPGAQGWGGKLSTVLEGLKVPNTVTTQPSDNVIPMDRTPLDKIEKHIRELMNSRVNCEAHFARLQAEHEEVCSHLRRWQATMSERMKELGIKCEIVEPSREGE